ncbi:MAG: MerR family transcriptional regulator [Candidatus Sulfomarinibacteraceae bacterium]
MAKAPDMDLPDDQEFFKLNEVCKLANVQPYMLRFWGTEFEQLETTTTETGQRLYSRPQMNLILEIRRLLFDEGLTIAAARKQVDDLVEDGSLDLEAQPAKPPAKKKPAKKKAPAKKAKTEPAETEAESKAEAVPEPQPEPEPKIEAASEVDKKPRADVQPLLATLRGVRKELVEIVAELKK